MLHQAARSGSAALVRIFLQFAADINHRDPKNRTALHEAMAGGHERAAWALLSEKDDQGRPLAQLALEDHDGLTPLMHGLLAARAAADGTDGQAAFNAVAVLAQLSEKESLVEQEKKLKELVKEKLLVQRSELIAAARDGHPREVRRWLGKLANPNIMDSSSVDPLRAAMTGHASNSEDVDQVVEQLLDFQANPNADPLNGRSPLGEAIFQNRCRCVQLLIQFGALPLGFPASRLSHYVPEALLTAQCQPTILHEILSKLPIFAWWHESIPVSKLLNIRLEACDSGDRNSHSRLQALHEFAATLLLDATPELQISFLCVLQVVLQTGLSPESIQVLQRSPVVRKVVDDLNEVHVVKELAGAEAEKVFSVAFSETHLASGSADEKVRVYDSEKFELVKVLDDAGGKVFSVAFAETHLASGSADAKVRIYDSEKFELVKVLDDAGDWVRSVAFSGTHLASGSDDKKVRIYDSEKFELVKVLDDAGDFVRSVAFSGTHLASGSDDQKVRIYDSEKFELVKVLDDAGKAVFSVAFSETYLASGSADAKVRIYDSCEFEPIKVLDVAGQSVVSLAFSEIYLASGSDDEKVRLYDLRDFHCFQDLRGSVAAFSGARLASGGVKLATIYKLDTDMTISGSPIASASACNLACAVAEQYGHATGKDFSDKLSIEYVHKLGNTASVRALAFSETHLASASDDQKVRIYDSEKFELVKVLDAGEVVFSVAFSGTHLASGSAHNKVRIYDSEKFELVKVVDDAGGKVFSVAFSGTHLASGSDDKKVRIYDSEKFELVKVLDDAGDFVRSVAFSGTHLASGSDDRKVRIYDSEKFELVKVLDDAGGWVRSVAFSETFLASGSGDAKVRIYDSEKFELVKVLDDAGGWVRSVAFSETFLASGSGDAKVRVYDSEKFEPIKVLDDAGDAVFSVAVSKAFLAFGRKANDFSRSLALYDISIFDNLKILQGMVSAA